MKIDFDDNEKYYQILLEFWNKLNAHEKIVFRAIIAQSTATYLWNGQEEDYYAQLIAINRFREDIWAIDLSTDTSKHWLSRATLTACKGLIDKGLRWVEDAYFEVGGLTIDFLEPKQIK